MRMPVGFKSVLTALVLAAVLSVPAGAMAGGALSFFLVGKIFDMAVEGAGSLMSGKQGFPSLEEMAQISANINSRLPAQISDDVAFIDSQVTGAGTLTFEFRWLSSKSEDLDWGYFDDFVGVPLKYYVCSSPQYTNWFGRNGILIFKFTDKSGAKIREYWSNRETCGI